MIVIKISEIWNISERVRLQNNTDFILHCVSEVTNLQLLTCDLLHSQTSAVMVMVIVRQLVQPLVLQYQPQSKKTREMHAKVVSNVTWMLLLIIQNTTNYIKIILFLDVYSFYMVRKGETSCNKLQFFIIDLTNWRQNDVLYILKISATSRTGYINRVADKLRT